MTKTGIDSMATPALSTSAFIAPARLGLQRSVGELVASTGRLSTGTRILEAGDDSASLSIATQLQSKLSGLKQAQLNIARGDTLTQVAQESLQRISDLLDSAQEAATQATGVSLLATERALLQAGIDQNLSDIDSIVANTTFNGNALLDGTLASGSETLFQVGADTSDTITVAISDIGSASLFSGGLPDVSTAANADDAVTAIAAASDTVQSQLSAVSAAQDRFGVAKDVVAFGVQGTQGANGALVDTDTTGEVASLARTKLVVDSGVSVVAQAQNLQSSLLDVLKAAAVKDTRHLEPHTAEEGVKTQTVPAVNESATSLGAGAPPALKSV